MKNDGDIEDIKIKRNCPTITHLLFVDDCYIFTKTKVKCAKNIKSFLENFSKAPLITYKKKTINYEKSEMIFSKYTPNLIRKSITKELGIKQVNNQGKYLGLPTSIGKNKINLFSYIENKLDK